MFDSWSVCIPLYSEDGYYVSFFFLYIFTHTCVWCVFHSHTPRGLVSTDTQLVFAEGLSERISSSPQAPFEKGSTRSRVLPLRVLVSRLKRFCVFPLGLFRQKAQGGSVRHSTLLSESGDARCEPGLSRLRNQPPLL